MPQRRCGACVLAPLTHRVLMDTIKLARRDDNFLREVEARSGQNLRTCYQCGNCTAGCPANFVYDDTVNQLMRGVQMGQKERVLRSRSLWLCLGCSTCSLRCPNDIDVARVMETLRDMAREEGYVSVPKINQFQLSFLNTVRQFGRSYEVGTMALYMLRSLRFWTDLDLVPDALKKKKLSVKPHTMSPEGTAAVQRIMERFQAKAQQKGKRL